MPVEIVKSTMPAYESAEGAFPQKLLTEL